METVAQGISAWADVPRRGGWTPEEGDSQGGESDRNAWKEFLLKRIASYETTIRFLVTSFLVVAGIVLSQFFAVVDQNVFQGQSLVLPFWTVFRAGWLVGVLVVVGSFTWRASAHLGKRRNLALQLVVEILKTREVGDIPDRWTPGSEAARRLPFVRYLE